MTPSHVPDTAFHTRERIDAPGNPNPFEWKTITSDSLFAGRDMVVFAVPGAFTPACSETHLPGYETHYDDFRALGIADVICLSVNDAFVMYQWAKSLNISKVRMLPDGNGEFSKAMGMLVSRSHHGMGHRSWRYSMHVTNGEIRKMFVEPGLQDNQPGIPVQVSDATTMLGYLQSS